MLQIIQDNIDALVQEFKINPLAIDQISLREFIKVLGVFMADQQLLAYMLPVINSEAKNSLYRRIQELSPNTCTLVDKDTLASKLVNSSPVSWEWFNKIAKQIHSSKIPRSLILEKTIDNNLNLYVLLGSKLAQDNADDNSIVRKSSTIKQHGQAKNKTNVLKVNLTLPVSASSIELMALLKNRKTVFCTDGDPNKERRAELVAESLTREAIFQGVLHQYCQGILPLYRLRTDQTFDQRRIYSLTDVGMCLYDYLCSDEEGTSVRYSNPELWLQQEPIRRGIANDLALTLCFLHKVGLVHRDVKIDNVIVTPINRARLADFEFCCAFGEANRYSGTINYTPAHYINLTQVGFRIRPMNSPDPDTCKLDLDDRKKLLQNMKIGHPGMDIWAFGITLFILHKGYDPSLFNNTMAEIKMYKDSSDPIELALNTVFFPALQDNYLTASIEEIKNDLQLPVSSRRFLSMERLYTILKGCEYELSLEVKQEAINQVNLKLKSAPPS